MWPPRKNCPELPRAFVMTDTERLSDPVSIINNLPKNVIVIFRHYNHTRRQSMACRVVESAHRRGLKVLIAGDLDLARKANADGIHFPSYMLGTWQAKQFANVPPYWLITAAIHNHRELKQASALNIDAVLLSPVYTTNTSVQRRALGLIGLRRLTDLSPVPLFALGGLNLSALPRLKNTGVAGFAGIREFLKFI